MRRSILALVLLCACDLGEIGGPMPIHDKLICNGNDAGFGKFELRATQEQIDEWGEAFAADGNCDAELDKSIIVSPGVAVRAGGNTKLVFTGGRIEGKPAMVLAGNATVELRGTEVVGDVETSGNAKVIGLDPAAEPTK